MSLPTWNRKEPIHGHRIVFVNNSTNIIDLIFPVLHEAVHAIRDEIQINNGFDAAEEAFCDKVANYIQFPDGYVRMVYDVINNQIDNITNRKLREILGIESVLDSKAVKDELIKLKEMASWYVYSLWYL